MPAPVAPQSTTRPPAPVPIRPGLPVAAFAWIGCVGIAFVRFRHAVTSADLAPTECAERKRRAVEGRKGGSSRR